MIVLRRALYGGPAAGEAQDPAAGGRTRVDVKHTRPPIATGSGNADQVDAFTSTVGRSSLRCGSVSIAATCSGWTSHGACPAGTSRSLAPGIFLIDGRACSTDRYGSSDPRMNVVGAPMAASSVLVRTLS